MLFNFCFSTLSLGLHVNSSGNTSAVGLQLRVQAVLYDLSIVNRKRKERKEERRKKRGEERRGEECEVQNV